MLKQSLRITRGILYPFSCFNCKAFVSFESSVPICPLCRQRLHLNRKPFCAGCGRHKEEGYPCPHCREKTRWIDHVYFVLLYEGISKKLIQRFKINRARELLPLVKELLFNFAESQLPHGKKYEVIVPIPSHHAHSRVPDDSTPSFTLSSILATFLRTPVRSILCRQGKMQKQSDLRKKERLSNVRGAFGLRRKGCRVDQRILLVDDVLTTGSTASECARILKEHGAREIDLLACARGKLS